MEVKNEAELKRDYFFDDMRMLNKGGFGWVSIIEHRQSRQLFALKAQHKGASASMDKNIKREKIALEAVDHPNIIKLLAVYEANQTVYFVMDLMTDLDLNHWCCKMYKGLRLDNVIYYTAELILALEYLRTKGFIHRDMKAKNVLMSPTNHVKLADFGMARKITDKHGRNILRGTDLMLSLCGTPKYHSPEIRVNDVVSYSVDVWGLAVIISEMYCGEWVCKPRNQDELLRRWFKRVHTGDYQWPAVQQPSPELHDLVKRLTRISPALRLGTASLDDVKRHPFLSGINWAILPHSTPPPLPPYKKFDKQSVTTPIARPVARPVAQVGHGAAGQFFDIPPPKHPATETPTLIDPQAFQSRMMRNLLRDIERPSSPGADIRDMQNRFLASRRRLHAAQTPSPPQRPQNLGNRLAALHAEYAANPFLRQYDRAGANPTPPPQRQRQPAGADLAAEYASNPFLRQYDRAGAGPTPPPQPTRAAPTPRRRDQDADNEVQNIMNRADATGMDDVLKGLRSQFKGAFKTQDQAPSPQAQAATRPQTPTPRIQLSSSSSSTTVVPPPAYVLQPSDLTPPYDQDNQVQRLPDPYANYQPLPSTEHGGARPKTSTYREPTPSSSSHRPTPSSSSHRPTPPPQQRRPSPAPVTLQQLPSEGFGGARPKTGQGYAGTPTGRRRADARADILEGEADLTRRISGVSLFDHPEGKPELRIEGDTDADLVTLSSPVKRETFRFDENAWDNMKLDINYPDDPMQASSRTQSPTPPRPTTPAPDRRSRPTTPAPDRRSRPTTPAPDRRSPATSSSSSSSPSKHSPATRSPTERSPWGGFLNDLGGFDAAMSHFKDMIQKGRNKQEDPDN